MTKLSIVSPCFNERASLRPLYAEIVAAFDGAGIDWEWIVVDDHSSDGSYEEIAALSRNDPRVRAIRTRRECRLAHRDVLRPRLRGRRLCGGAHRGS